MAYADYEFYKSVYVGNLSENEFDRLSERASDYIDSRTDYILRKKEVPDNLIIRVKKACCAVAETYKLNENGGGKTSESVDGYSVSYLAGSTTYKTDDQRLDNAVQLYISDLVRAVSWI